MNTKNLLALFAASAAASALASDGEMSRPQGIPIGERMTLRPYVSLSFTYDSNVDQMKHSQDGSQWIVNPGLNLDYKGENWSVEGAVWYQYHAYNNYSHQLNQSNYGEHLKAAWTNSKQDEKGWSALFTERFQQINQDDDLRSNNGRGKGDDLRGKVHWSGYTSYGMNSYSIGIEMCHVNGQNYTKAQLKAVDRLIAYIDKLYGGYGGKIIDHKDWRPSNSDTDANFAKYLKNYKKYRKHTA